MNRTLLTPLVLAAGLGAAVGAPALAQPMGDPGPVVASQPVPDTSRASPGIPGPEAVNPAPGAHGPYIGAGRQGFYDVDARIAAVGRSIAALPPGQRRRAASQLHAIKAEESFKRAKYGDLRDWDREHLNAMLDQLIGRYPGLGATGPGQ